jgi:hypothetical protein
MRRRIAMLAALVLAVAAPAAEGKIWFEDLRGRQLQPWALVRTHIGGCQQQPGCIPGIAGTPAYALTPWRRLPRSCRGIERGHRAGRITDRGVLQFRAPRRPGRYRLAIGFRDGDVCRPMPASPVFRVVAPAP